MSAGIGSSDPPPRRQAKAAGTALYAADFAHAGVAHAALTLSAVAKGRITSIDTSEAEAVPGVQLVLTHRSFNQDMGEETFIMKGGHMQSSFMPLSSDAVHYAGQIIGIVVADTVEAAEEASRKIRVAYAPEHASAAMDDPGRTTETDDSATIAKGDADAAFAAAPVKIDQIYATPAQHHNPIELYATTAAWQTATAARQRAEPVGHGHAHGPRLDLRHPAGGRACREPLCRRRLRQQGDHPAVHRADRLGRQAARAAGQAGGAARRDVHGGLVPPRHAGARRARRGARRHADVAHLRGGGAEFGDRPRRLHGRRAIARMYDSERCAPGSRRSRPTSTRPASMRAPAEACSFFGFESAVDELAEALDMDPIALRLKNEPKVDPVKGVPWSSRSLVQCFKRGAELFGWDKRQKVPGMTRTPDGLLIGYGCATATYPSAMAPAAARVTLSADGMVQVSTAAHDIGTGAYTVLGQVAGGILGVTDDHDRASRSATAPCRPGRWPAGRSPRGLRDRRSTSPPCWCASACSRVRPPPARPSPGSIPSASRLPVTTSSARTAAATRSPRCSPTLAAARIEEMAEWKPESMDLKKMQAGLAGGMAFNGPVTDTHTSFSFGAQFAEVHIDPMVRTIQLARMVGVFACGKIVNPRTAQSNLAGGMIWGASFALLEESRVDRPRAKFANTDLAGYHISSHADIGEVVVETIDEEDKLVNAIGAKAVGEVGIVGMPAAIANAVYNATGIRVRKTPILVEDLL